MRLVFIKSLVAHRIQRPTFGRNVQTLGHQRPTDRRAGRRAEQNFPLRIFRAVFEGDTRRAFCARQSADVEGRLSIDADYPAGALRKVTASNPRLAVTAFQTASPIGNPEPMGSEPKSNPIACCR